MVETRPSEWRWVDPTCDYTRDPFIPTSGSSTLVSLDRSYHIVHRRACFLIRRDNSVTAIEYVKFLFCFVVHRLQYAAVFP